MDNLWSWLQELSDDQKYNPQIDCLRNLDQKKHNLLPTAVLLGEWFHKLASHNGLGGVVSRLLDKNEKDRINLWEDKVNDIDYPDEFPEMIWEIYNKLMRKRVVGLKVAFGWEHSTSWPVVYVPIHGESNLAVAIKHGIGALGTQMISINKKVDWSKMRALVQPVYEAEFSCVVKGIKGQIIQFEIVHGDEDWGLMEGESPQILLVGHNSRTIYKADGGNQKHRLEYGINKFQWIEANKRSLDKNVNEKAIDLICDDFNACQNEIGAKLEIKYQLTGDKFCIKSAVVVENVFEKEYEKVEMKLIGIGHGLHRGRARGYLTRFENKPIKSDEIALIDKWSETNSKLLIKCRGVIVSSSVNQSDFQHWLREIGIPGITEYKPKTNLTGRQVITMDGQTGMVYLEKVHHQITKLNYEPMKQTVVEKVNLATHVWVEVSKAINSELNSSIAGAVWNTRHVWSKLNAHPKHAENNRIRDLIEQEFQSTVSTLANQLTPRPLIIQLAKMEHQEWRNLNYGKVYETDDHHSAQRYLNHDWQLFTEMSALRELRQTLRMTNLWVEISEARSIEEIRLLKKQLVGLGLLRTHSFQLWVEITNWNLGDYMNELAEIGIDGINLDWRSLLRGYLGYEPVSDQVQLSRQLVIHLTELVRSANKLGITVHMSLLGSHLSQVLSLLPSGITNVRIIQDSATHLFESLAEAEKLVVRSKG